MPSVSEQKTVSALIASLPSPCIVELGAHTGEDEEWLRGAAADPDQVHYVMVEPDPRNCQAILERGPIHRTRRLIIGAVAEASGFRSFNFSVNLTNGGRTSGSLRKPSGHLKYFPEIEFPFVGTVAVYTLDEIFEREWLTKIDLLWVDIQGAENLMIAGGPVALSHTRYLFMEVEKEELYQGEGLRDDLVKLLPAWEVIAEWEFNILMQNFEFVERGPR